MIVYVINEESRTGQVQYRKNNQEQKSGLNNYTMWFPWSHRIFILLKTSPLNCNWTIHLISRDVVTELTKNQRKTKSLSCFFSGDLTIILTMHLVTLKSRLFSRCVFIGSTTKVLWAAGTANVFCQTETSLHLKSHVPLTSQEMQHELCSHINQAKQGYSLHSDN